MQEAAARERTEGKRASARGAAKSPADKKRQSAHQAESGIGRAHHRCHDRPRMEAHPDVHHPHAVVPLEHTDAVGGSHGLAGEGERDRPNQRNRWNAAAMQSERVAQAPNTPHLDGKLPNASSVIVARPGLPGDGQIS